MRNMFNINDTTGRCGEIVQHASEFLPYAHKRLGFNKPVGVNFISDLENAKDPFGKTGYYDPNKMEITIFVDKRHVKDVLRSLSHELVHHTQNCRGEYDQGIETGDGYAQKDPHMRKMEAEAYLLGNGFLFRDYEDQLKENNTMIKSLLNEKALNKLADKIFETLKEAENPLRTGKSVGQRKKGAPPVPGTLAKKIDEPRLDPRKAKIVKTDEEQVDENQEIINEDETRKSKWRFLGPAGNKVTVTCDDCTKTEAKSSWEKKHSGKKLRDMSTEKSKSEPEKKPQWKPTIEPKAESLELEENLPSKEAGAPEVDVKTGKPLKLPKTNENWFKGNKDQLLFDRLTKKWAK